MKTEGLDMKTIIKNAGGKAKITDSNRIKKIALTSLDELCLVADTPGVSPSSSRVVDREANTPQHLSDTWLELASDTWLELASDTWLAREDAGEAGYAPLAPSAAKRNLRQNPIN